MERNVDNDAMYQLNIGFAEGGAWEQNDGRNQTRLFATFFCKTINLDYEKEFSLLDAGCALGDAVRVFAERYPNAKITAVDVSPVAVERAKEKYGHLANFLVCNIDEISNNYDVIYISNVLEHYLKYQDKARYLTKKCNRLCIMVPYDEREKQGGKPITPDPSHTRHQYPFYEDSFNFLVKEGFARRIETYIISCPGTWGWDRRQRITHGIDNFFRKITGRPIVLEPLQIIYDIFI